MFEFLAKIYQNNKDFIDNLISGGGITIIFGLIGFIWWYFQQKRQRRLTPASLPLPFDAIPPGGKVLPLVYKERDPNNTDPLADQNLPYKHRDCNLDYRHKIRDLLEKHRWVIILGPTGIGKTREAAEVAQRLNNEGWTIVCLKLGAWLDRPTGEQLQALGTDRKLLFFLDDLNQYARRSLEVEQNPNARDSPLAPINISFQERLLQTLEYYENHCTRAEEVRVIATARNETQPDSDGQPSEWEKLQWEKYPKLWDRFAMLELPNPEDGAIAELLQETVGKTDIPHQNADYLDISSYNDSTFRNVVENLVRLRANKLPLDRANYQSTLRGSWEKRYRDAIKRDPLARYVYEAIDLLRQCDIPLEAFIVEPTARMIAGGNWWQKIRYRWQMPRTLANLEAKEKILTPRDGQIEERGKRTELTDYLYALTRLVWKLFDRSPERTKVALLKLSNKLTILKRYSEALEGYNRLIPSESSYIWFYLGFVLEELGKHEEALASYGKAIEFQPDYAKAWFNRGVVLGNLNGTEEALASFEKVIEFQPDDSDAWFNRGVVLGKLGRTEEELASYEKVIEFQPDYTKAWFNRGIVLGKLGRNEEALASYDKAIEFQPDDSDAWFNRGVVLRKLGRNEEELVSYDKVIEFRPDDSDAWCNRGVVLGKLGRTEEELASYERAIEFQPDLSEAWYNRGVVLAYLQRYQEAIDSYRKSLTINPNFAGAYYNIARCYALQDNLPLAIENLQRAITLDEQNREMARTDQDFDRIREREEFKQLLDPPG